MKSTQSKFSFAELPMDYSSLCQFHPPRRIRDKTDLENTIEITDAMAGHKLTADQEDYFDLLCSLIEEWQEDHRQRFKVTGIDALKQLMDAQGMKTVDLARLLNVHRSLGAMILRGERQLTLGHVARLANHFAVSADLFVTHSRKKQ